MWPFKPVKFDQLPQQCQFGELLFLRVNPEACQMPATPLTFKNRQWVLDISQIKVPNFIPTHSQFAEMLSLCNIHDM